MHITSESQLKMELFNLISLQFNLLNILKGLKYKKNVFIKFEMLMARLFLLKTSKGFINNICN